MIDSVITSKDVFWNINNKMHNGFAVLFKDKIAMCNEQGYIFDKIREHEIPRKHTIEEFFKMIPKNISEFNLKERKKNNE